MTVYETQIIRYSDQRKTIESGHGPCWMAPSHVTPLKRWLEKLVHTRFLTWLSPCVWGDADGYSSVRHFLHGTAVGRFFVDTFWGILGSDVITLNKYDAHPDTAKLKPWIGAFWIATTLSILNYDTNFFDVVKQDNVKVHVADITQLSRRKVHLSSGETFNTDAFLLCTGWKHTSSIEYIPASLEERLGLPHANSSTNKEQQSLESRADSEILFTYPRLKKRPVEKNKFKPLSNADSPAATEEQMSGMNLYRFMVPADEELLEAHDIAFVGNLMTITTPTVAEIQSLWITAYFDGKVTPLAPQTSSSRSTPPSQTVDPAAESDPQIASVQYSATLHNRFGKWRYPGGWGGKIPDFVFDALPYMDMLLTDLGVKSRRKSGFLKEISEPYGPEDYVGIVDEWMKGQKE
jgi:hypothetical protein